MRSLLLPNDVLTASGKYPERKTNKEVTVQVLANIDQLLRAVNGLMGDLGVTKSLVVTSGFRPTKVNANIANAAKKSLHQIGLAVDLLDDNDQSLAKRIMANPELLTKWDLWLEHPDHTRGKHTNWVHLDLGTRSPRMVRVFKP